MPKKPYFKQFASKKERENFIDNTDVFPIQAYMITSVSINKSITNYTTGLEFTKVEHARGSQAGHEGLGVNRRQCQTQGEPYTFPRAEYSWPRDWTLSHNHSHQKQAKALEF